MYISVLGNYVFRPEHRDIRNPASQRIVANHHSQRRGHHVDRFLIDALLQLPFQAFYNDCMFPTRRGQNMHFFIHSSYVRTLEAAAIRARPYFSSVRWAYSHELVHAPTWLSQASGANFVSAIWFCSTSPPLSACAGFRPRRTQARDPSLSGSWPLSFSFFLPRWWSRHCQSSFRKKADSTSGRKRLS